jgi:hypothetical protein
MKAPDSNAMPLGEAYARICDLYDEAPGKQMLRRALIEYKIPSFGRRASHGSPNDKRGRIEDLPPQVWELAHVEWQEGRIHFALSQADDPRILSWQHYRPVTDTTDPVPVQGDVVYVEIEVSRKHFDKWASPETVPVQSSTRGKPGPKLLQLRDNEIRRRIEAGNYPGASGTNVPWDRFNDEIRDACDGWVDRRKGLKSSGFSDKTIARAVSRLAAKR